MALKVKRARRVGEGEEEGEKLDRKTARELRLVANSVMPRSVIMEEDFPSNHASGRLLILDMVMWVKNITIFHEPYAKPMASKAVVMAKSAFPASTKKNILLEEGSRRLRNCSPKLQWKEKLKHLERFSVAMAEGGHTVQYRKMIIIRVLARYETSLENQRLGTKRMYRT